jgi:hypothetical protein
MMVRRLISAGPLAHVCQCKGLSTCVRICVRVAIRFRAQFVRKQKKEPIIFLLAIAMVCLHISANKNKKLTCLTPLAANRTPNRMGISMGNRTCRRPLTVPLAEKLLQLRPFATGVEMLPKIICLDFVESSSWTVRDDGSFCKPAS